MTVADPTYPLYPVSCIVSSALLLLTLSTSFVRQSWNLGVTFLCFWLFWENLTNGINAIVWSNNYEVKFYIYCDIVSHLQIVAFVVKPMCTLIVIRRLHLIASHRSVDLPSTREKHINMAIEWTLGLLIPLLIAGPVSYAVQNYRFITLEGFGCRDSHDGTILSTLLIDCWSVIPPLMSVVIYYPKVVWVFYRRRRDTNRFLQSNNSISRTNYSRILALASVDILFTLPSGITNVVLNNINNSEYYDGHVPFYNGWNETHSPWDPVGISYAEVESGGHASFAQLYFLQWTSPVLACIIFGLFGLTANARATYWRAGCFVGRRFGWKPTPRESAKTSALDTMEFNGCQQEISLHAELGSRPSVLDLEPVVGMEPGDASHSDKIAQEWRVVSNDLGHNSSSGDDWSNSNAQ